MTAQPLIHSGSKPSIRMEFVLATVFVVVACGGDGGATQGGSPGTEGSHCYPNGTCNSGLLCHHKPPLDVCEKTTFDIPAPPVNIGIPGVDAGGATGAGGATSTGGAAGVPISAGGATCTRPSNAGGAMGTLCTKGADCAGPGNCALCGDHTTVECVRCECGRCSGNLLDICGQHGGVNYQGICGNGYFDPNLEPGEECDGANLNGATCDSVSSGALPYGKLFCSPSCTLILQGCSAVPIGTGGAASSGGATSTGGTDAGQVTDAAPG